MSPATRSYWRIPILIILSIFALLPLFVLGIIAWESGNSTLRMQAGGRLQAAAISRQGQINAWLDGLTGTLYGVTTADTELLQALTVLDSQKVNQRLDLALDSQFGDPTTGQGFHEIFAITVDGHLLSSTDPARASVPVSACNTAAICVFGPFAEGSNLWIGIQYPVLGAGGQPIAALIGLADARHLDLILDNGQSYLLGAAGDLRWLPNYGIIPHPSKPLPTYNPSLTISEPAEYSGVYGDPAFGVAAYLPRLNAWLVDEQALAEVVQPIAVIPWAMLSLGALSLALILPISRLLAKRLEDDQAPIRAQLVEQQNTLAAMADAAQVRNQMIASMSHELRTSLSATLNFSGFLLDGLFGELTAEQAEPTHQIYDSAQHLLELINDLLDIARIESGQMQLFPADFDPAPLIEQTVATLRALTLGKPVAIQTDLPTSWPTLHGDRRRVLQILLNLIANAAKFTETGTIMLRAHVYPDKLEIRVEDSGPGIDPTEVTQLFVPFHQGHNAALLEKGGSGLGLPLSRIFARLHNGDVTYEPGPHGGSTFMVWLPIKAGGTKIALAAPDRA